MSAYRELGDGAEVPARAFSPPPVAAKPPMSYFDQGLILILALGAFMLAMMIAVGIFSMRTISACESHGGTYMHDPSPENMAKRAKYRKWKCVDGNLSSPERARELEEQLRGR